MIDGTHMLSVVSDAGIASVYLEVEDRQAGLHLCHDLGRGQAALVEDSPGLPHIRPAPAVRQSHKVNLILPGQLGQALLHKNKNKQICLNKKT